MQRGGAPGSGVKDGAAALASPVPLPRGQDSACQARQQRLLCPCAGNGEPAERDRQGRGQPAPLQPMAGKPSHPGCPDPNHVPPAELLLSVPVSRGLRGHCAKAVGEWSLAAWSHLVEGHSTSDVAKRALNRGGTWPSCQSFAPLLRQGSR